MIFAGFLAWIPDALTAPAALNWRATPTMLTPLCPARPVPCSGLVHPSTSDSLATAVSASDIRIRPGCLAPARRHSRTRPQRFSPPRWRASHAA